MVLTASLLTISPLFSIVSSGASSARLRLRVRREIGLAPPDDVLRMTAHLETHLSSLTVMGSIGRVITNDVTAIDTGKNSRIYVVGLIWLLQIIGPASGVFGQAH